VIWKVYNEVIPEEEPAVNTTSTTMTRRRRSEVL